MSGQLGRVHALLAAGNVPCELKRRRHSDFAKIRLLGLLSLNRSIHAI